MIKTLIKYIISETAINSFFDNVNQNFCSNNYIFTVGNWYNTITIVVMIDVNIKNEWVQCKRCIVFNKCKIVKITHDHIIITYKNYYIDPLPNIPISFPAVICIKDIISYT